MKSKELTQLNQHLQSKVTVLNDQLAALKTAMRDALEKEREQANTNAQAAIASLKQARLDLQRLFEEKEEIVRDNRRLSE